MKIKNFTKTIKMVKQDLDFKDKMTDKQFNYICSLQKKQIGKVQMNYQEIKKYLTKIDATTLIQFMLDGYNDINVILEIKNPVVKNKPKRVEVIPATNKAKNLQLSAIKFDMFNTMVKTFNK